MTSNVPFALSVSAAARAVAEDSADLVAGFTDAFASSGGGLVIGNTLFAGTSPFFPVDILEGAGVIGEKESDGLGLDASGGTGVDDAEDVGEVTTGFDPEVGGGVAVALVPEALELTGVGIFTTDPVFGLVNCNGFLFTGTLGAGLGPLEEGGMTGAPPGPRAPETAARCIACCCSCIMR